MKQPKILFKDTTHAYVSQKGNYTSNSAFVGTFMHKFDAEFNATRSVFKSMFKNEWMDALQKTDNDAEKAVPMLKEVLDPSQYRFFVDELINAWEEKGKKSAQIGTMFHKQLETEAIETGMLRLNKNRKNIPVNVNTFVPDGYDNCTWADNLYDIPDGAYVEFIVFNDLIKVAGTIDMLFVTTINGVRYVDIDDYKFVEELRKRPKYWSYKDKDKMHMKHPVSHLYQTNYFEYNLKISMYAWMLEQFGFKLRYLLMSHMKPTLNGEFARHTYTIKYMKPEIELMIQYYAKQKNIDVSKIKFDTKLYF